MLHKLLPALLLAALTAAFGARADDLARSIQSDYDAYLGELFDHFHRNPELSHMEHATAARLAELAIHLGASDNITVIVVRFFQEGESNE